MRKLFILIVCCIWSSTSNAQQYNLNDFVETNPSKYPEKEWLELNRAPVSFNVTIVNNILTLNKDVYSSQTQLDIEGGKLIGINRGEWGGVLLYKGNTSPIDTIKGGNLVKIFKFQNQIYFLEGLAHMSFNSGSLYRFNKRGSKFTYAKVVDFKDAPQSLLIFKDKILVAGFNNFYSIENGRCETLFKNMFWESLYPNSIAAIHDSEVYVGIRGGFVKLNMMNRTFKFYRYKYLPKVIDP